VNSEELIDILCERIGQGFTFPLNPKWILCDPGWKLVYDKLMASRASNVQSSLSIWYPEGIRRRIDEISTKFPHGFAKCNYQAFHRNSMSAGLAELELKRYSAVNEGRKKLRSAFQKRRRDVNNYEPTLFSTTLQMLQVGKEVDTLRQQNHSSGAIVDDRSGHSLLGDEKGDRREGKPRSGSAKRGTRKTFRGANLSEMRKSLQRCLSRKRSDKYVGNTS